MKKMLSFVLAAALATGVQAGRLITESCDCVLDGGNSHPLLSWETNHVGDIIISLKDGEGATNTVFRASGMSDGINVFYIVPADNHNNNTEAKNYFYQELDGNRFILHRKSRSAEDEAFLAGKHIKFDDKAVQWRCNEGDKWESITYFFPYDKSLVCGATLNRPNAPVIAADGTVTFDAVTDATSYSARVYYGLDLVHEQSIVSGGKLTWRPYEPASTTYEITIQAFGAGDTKSRESEAGTWTTTGDLANLPVSKYCGDYVFQAPGNDASRARLTIQTHRGSGAGVKDTVVFTISKYDESEVSDPYWRSKGLNPNGLRYDGNTFTDYFELADGISPHQQKEIRYVPKDGMSVPLGKKITYNIGVNAQSAEWATAGNNNAATNAWTIDYVYGTSCPSLPAPTHVAVSADSVITFDAVAGAEKYIARMYLNSQLVHSAEVESGDVLHYTPFHAGTYVVTVTARASGSADSPESEPYLWVLQAVQIVPGKSEYCDYAIGSGTTLAFMTWETDADGNVVITISGGEDVREGYSFRGQGMDNTNLDNFKISGRPAKTWFERKYDNGSNQPFKLLVKSGENAPVPGEKITYSGTVEWKTPDNTNAYTTYSFTYTYGTKCAEPLVPLTTPVISGITPQGVISFEAVENAVSYVIRIYDADADMVSEQSISSGAKINRGSAIEEGFDYTVRLQAIPEAGSVVYAPSEWSSAYNWTPDNATALPEAAGETATASKEWKDGKLYIRRNGILYDATGALIRQ